MRLAVVEKVTLIANNQLRSQCRERGRVLFHVEIR